MSERDVLQQTIAEIAQNQRHLDADAFKEIYWQPKDECCPVGVVVAHGTDAVATLREAMGMLREEGSVQSEVAIVDGDAIRPAQFSKNPDVPSHDLSHQQNSDLDVVLAAISDIVRTYPDSPDELNAIRTAHAACSNAEEVTARIFRAVLLLMMTNEDISSENVARFLSMHRRVAWHLKHLSGSVVL